MTIAKVLSGHRTWTPKPIAKLNQLSSLVNADAGTFPYVCEVDFIFFFQAEDGIRDADVTGVQTCALPICPRYQDALCPTCGTTPRYRQATVEQRIARSAWP